jgi:hypothetical protein
VFLGLSKEVGLGFLLLALQAFEWADLRASG